MWHLHKGQLAHKITQATRPLIRSQMCPSGLALLHPAAELLLQYATTGCPVQTGPNNSPVPSVNSTTIKTAPKGSVDQLGHVLHRIIHAFASANIHNTRPIYMAKWDIKDGFWRLGCEDDQEWNFAYVLPSSVGPNPSLVIPTSLQMGWIESPAYFCAASETARDVASQHAELPLATMPRHKFLSHKLPFTTRATSFKYMLEDYVDDFVDLAIPESQQQLDHIANATLHGIHDVFPANTNSDEDPISLKKLLKGEGAWDTTKEILGLTFDGVHKTVWLSTEKRDALLSTLTSWVRKSAIREGIA